MKENNPCQPRIFHPERFFSETKRYFPRQTKAEKKTCQEWHTPVISAMWQAEEENCKFKADQSGQFSESLSKITVKKKSLKTLLSDTALGRDCGIDLSTTKRVFKKF
jgi:hypothetical protein